MEEGRAYVTLSFCYLVLWKLRFHLFKLSFDWLENPEITRLIGRYTGWGSDEVSDGNKGNSGMIRWIAGSDSDVTAEMMRRGETRASPLPRLWAREEDTADDAAATAVTSTNYIAIYQCSHKLGLPEKNEQPYEESQCIWWRVLNSCGCVRPPASGCDVELPICLLRPSVVFIRLPLRLSSALGLALFFLVLPCVEKR